MKQRIVRYSFVCVLGFGLATLPVSMFAADDTKTPAKDTPTPTKLPDYSKYTLVNDVTGEVIKANDKKLSLRIYFPAIKGQATPHPQLSQFPVPNPVLNPRQNQQLTQAHQDYDIPFIPESLVRTLVLPPKPDENGKKVAYTQKEKEVLKAPTGVKGYAASISDLTPGTMVDVILIRDKSVSAAKATDDDARVKFAIIQSPSTTAPKKN